MSSKWSSEKDRRRVRRLVRVLGVAAFAGVVVVSVASGVASRAATAPANSSAPSISGSTTAGTTVTANPGTWTGSTPIGYQYQWQICDGNGNACHDIGGATSQTYKIRSEDKGNTLRVHVIASNSDGSSAATSAPSTRIAEGGSAPANTAAPTISGSPSVGSTLTATTENWTGTTPISFGYQWEICDGNGNACHDIGSATAQTYQVRTGDPGNTVRVRVTASNSFGSASAISAPTAKVVAPAPATGCPALASGAQSVSVNAISAPARLQITEFTATPNVIPGSMHSFTVRFHVADTCGHAVQGAQVYATAVPFNQVTIPAPAMTDGAGNTTVQFNRRSGFPAARKQQLMVLFVRASRPGDNTLAGISTRRLISLRVALGAV